MDCVTVWNMDTNKKGHLLLCCDLLVFACLYVYVCLSLYDFPVFMGHAIVSKLAMLGDFVFM